MAQKGVNTRILEAKDNLTASINECLKDGIPASIISIIVENILMDLNVQVKLIVDEEKKEYEHQSKVESEQVVYEEPKSEPDPAENIKEE